MRTKKNTKSVIWIITLTVVFFCFGILLMAQYYTHREQTTSLAKESPASLAMIVKAVNDNKNTLTAELEALQQQLNKTEDMIESGIGLSSSMRNRINSLQIVTGDKAVTGTGISVTITGESHLQYFDLIDLINELFVSGAEAVSINDIRFTIHTHISDEEIITTVTDAEGRTYQQRGFMPMVNGKELLYPIVIKAIGDPATLSTGLKYPGGIVESLESLYMIYPVIKKMDQIIIPATSTFYYKQSNLPETTDEDKN